VASPPPVLVKPESDAAAIPLTLLVRSSILDEPDLPGPAAPARADEGAGRDDKGLRVVIRYVDLENPAAYEAGLADARRAFIETILDELADGRLKL
jgi:hypothetical protein